jgi:hypothetical protein
MGDRTDEKKGKTQNKILIAHIKKAEESTEKGVKKTREQSQTAWKESTEQKKT